MSKTIFSKVDYDLDSLMKFIALGEIALPDIQRPFVWPNAKVRNLFDSMYRGYPVGYFLFWQNAIAENTKAIGTDNKQKAARLLIVDGQQRLTSLYAVIRGISVVRENYDKERIEIAFNPLTEEFSVSDAAVKNDRNFIPDISVLWSEENDFFDLVDDYLEGVEAVNSLASEERKAIKRAIQRVAGLLSFPLTAIELSGTMDEEDVAEVFVRINSEGKKLNQADFILTLMSVFWEQGRKDLEEFCKQARLPDLKRASSFNVFIKPDPDQLLRVGVGLAFKRARLKYVYSMLRGKDLKTGDVSDELRVKQFDLFQNAQSRVLNLQFWQDYLLVLRAAGFRGEKMISSQTNIVYTYVFYLIGRTELGVDEHKLRKVLAQWFFMSALTGRYSSSPESKMEFDLARFGNIKDPDEFCDSLQQACAEALTSDYWSINLPGDLATAAGRSPAQLAYFASLVLLEANVLFSEQKVHDLLEPASQGKRSAIEKHHLFPKAHLKKSGITTIRETNQLANYALVEWGDNGKAADNDPEKYLPEFLARFNQDDIERMYYWHALPEQWEKMGYQEFLKARRERMAKVIADAYAKLSGVAPDSDNEIAIEDLVEIGESDEIEFKSTLRFNLHTGEKDSRMEFACVKTIAGFLNRDGGSLVIGVGDDGSPLGLDTDGFANEDKLNLHMTNLLNAKLGAQFSMYITQRFEDYEGVRTYIVSCIPSRAPVYLKEGQKEQFFVRTGASTTEITGKTLQEYIALHFD